jgi:signal transduction histidine kinase
VSFDLASCSPDLTAAAPSAVVTAALAPLLDNAVRHARSSVRVWTESSDDVVRVVVEDDGDGVGADVANRIFEAGFTTRDEGIGLGLPLARRLARSTGGDIAVVPGARGHFALVLPRP